jgi:hypothetical protein
MILDKSDESEPLCFSNTNKRSINMSKKRDIDVTAEAGLIWKIANDVLRDIFQRTEYPDIRTLGTLGTPFTFAV